MKALTTSTTRRARPGSLRLTRYVTRTSGVLHSASLHRDGDISLECLHAGQEVLLRADPLHRPGRLRRGHLCKLLGALLLLERARPQRIASTGHTTEVEVSQDGVRAGPCIVTIKVKKRWHRPIEHDDTRPCCHQMIGQRRSGSLFTLLGTAGRQVQRRCVHDSRMPTGSPCYKLALNGTYMYDLRSVIQRCACGSYPAVPQVPSFVVTCNFSPWGLIPPCPTGGFRPPSLTMADRQVLLYT